MCKEKIENIKVLDAGCGLGGLVRYLQNEGYDVYGYDITGSGHDSNLQQRINDSLGTDISTKVRLIDYRDSLPFADEYFDFVISNQVLEHVNDFDHFFSENKRVLKMGGSMIHCFPVKNIIVEPHLFLPLIHRMPHRFIPYYYWIFKRNSSWKFALNRKNYIENKVFYRSMSFFKKQHGFEFVGFQESINLLFAKFGFLNIQIIRIFLSPFIFSFFSSITLIYYNKRNVE
jgi:SAM-dependent methyltransferase